MGEKLHYDIFRNLTRFTAYDISLHASCSLGLEISRQLCSFGECRDSTIHLPCMNADQTCAVIIHHKSKLELDKFAYVQFTISYTNSIGESRIRIFNYSFPITDKLSIVSIICR